MSVEWRSPLRTIRNHIFFQNPKPVLQREGLKAGKCSTDAKIQGDASFNGMDLIHIEFNWMLSGIVYLPANTVRLRLHTG